MSVPLFSIIVVCLNPGNKLKLSLKSILMQNCNDYEIIVKDGGSDGNLVDKTVEEMNTGSIRLINKKDAGIYEGMNQAVSEAEGKYVYFLNCGDELYNEDTLTVIKEQIIDAERKIREAG